MRKLMLLAAMLAMVLMVAAPAVAQPAGKTTICHATGSTTNPYVVITVSNNALPAHEAHQGGRDIIPAPQGAATTVEDCIAAAEVVTPDVKVPKVDVVTPDVSVVTPDVSVVTPDADADVDVQVLPDTGGASLFVLGAGALLVGGGLLARRIFS